MAIHYTLHSNKTIAGENRCVARAHSNGTIQFESFVDRICQAGTTVSKADALAVLTNMDELIAQALADGFNVRTRSAVYSIEIRGVFESESDHFDPNRHEVCVRIRPTSDFNRTITRDAYPTKVATQKAKPLLRTLVDAASGQQNSVLTAGGIARLDGYRLKFDESDPEQGVFLIGEDRSITRALVVSENRPSRISFLVPYLPQGFYQLAVRARISGGEKVEVGFFDQVLSLVPPRKLLGETITVPGLLPPS